MAEKEIIIRESGFDDLGDIFRLYAGYMFDSRLLKLGRPFVKNYLNAILKSKNCVSLTAYAGHTVGFIMAAFDCGKMHKELLLNKSILFAAARAVFTHPIAALRNFTILFYPFKTGLKNVKAELLFISIDPAYRRQELAVKMIRQVLCQMQQKGVSEVKVSVLVKNEAVNALLESMGFEIKKTFSLFSRDMYLYYRRLDQ